MDEFLELLTNWAHWGFEIVSDVVLSLAILAIPARLNPAKRWLARHDKDVHHYES